MIVLPFVCKTAMCALRDELIARDRRCFYCGFALCFFNATLDHVRPRRHYGRTVVRNMRLACERCNNTKQDALLSEIGCSIQRGVGINFVRGQLMETTIVGFNYQALGSKVGKETEQHATAIHELVERNTANVIEIGRRLIDVHALIGGHRFQAWLKAEFRWSQACASNYMQVAERFGTLDCVRQFQPSALFALMRKPVPAAAVEEAIVLARTGETITKQNALQIANKHRPPAQQTPAPRPKTESAADNLRAIVKSIERREGKEFVLRLIVQLAGEIEPSCVHFQPTAKGKPQRYVSIDMCLSWDSSGVTPSQPPDMSTQVPPLRTAPSETTRSRPRKAVPA